jgi:hypothetical protein
MMRMGTRVPRTARHFLARSTSTAFLLVTGALAGTAVTGCVAAAAAGAGAATAAYLTSRGAKAVVDQPVDRAASNAEAAMNRRNISISGQSTKNSGAERELKGTTQGGEEVTITLNQDRKNARLTDVDVSVKKNTVEWDQTLAKQIADDIVGQTNKG